ncbi:MAG: rutR [Burkholderiaceae bacterium]|nr:rutR [Burkholderiaceae bacterium]
MLSTKNCTGWFRKEMRKKTEAKKQAILKVATEVFREMGFQNTSMNEIAARLGGSKATLYNYFPSKSEIFLEVVRELASKQEEQVVSFLEVRFPALTEDCQHKVDELFLELQHPNEDIAVALRRFGAKLLQFICAPEMLEIRRLLIAEAGRSDIGRFYYESGPKRGMERIAEFFRRAMDEGRLREADASIAAAHFRGLLEADVQERRLYGVDETVTDEVLARTVENAVSVFLAAYGKK